MRIPIQECTPAQLLHFLQVKIGAKNLQPNGKIEYLRKEVLKYVNDTEIEVDEAGGDQGPRAVRGGPGVPPKGKADPLRFAIYDPTVNITLHPMPGKGGNRNLMLGSNGESYFIPRGRAVDIPYRYFLILEEAKGEIHDGWDGNAEGLNGLKGANAEPRETSSYTYTVNRRPSDEDIERWHETMEPHYEKQRRSKMARIRATRINADAEARAS